MVSVKRDIAYGDHPRQLLDVHTADPSEFVSDGAPQNFTTDAERPAIIDIHGGGWYRGNKEKEDPIAAEFARRGYIVFSPNYRLAPEFPFPIPRQDVLAAYQWALDSSYEFDRHRVVFFGGSAGGNLSVEAAMATGRPGVSWSGIFDLAGFIAETDGKVAEGPLQPDDPSASNTAIDQGGPDDPFMIAFILTYVNHDRSQLEAATTRLRVTKDSGPVYLANSANEMVHVDDPISLLRAFADVQVDATLQIVPGTTHALGYTDHALPATLAWIANHI
jgi:acetyl esterase